MVVRMVPIAQLFGRFRRLIHDLERDTGKRIELSTEGETTELDKTVIERLADPLIHLIRNSADHGLEGAEPLILYGPIGTILDAQGHKLVPGGNPNEIGAVTAIRSTGYGGFEAVAETVRRGGGSAMVVNPIR